MKDTTRTYARTSKAALARQQARNANRANRRANRTERVRIKNETIQRQGIAKAIGDSVRDTVVGVSTNRTSREVMQGQQNKERSLTQAQLEQVMNVMYNKGSDGNRSGGNSTGTSDGTQSGSGLND